MKLNLDTKCYLFLTERNQSKIKVGTKLHKRSKTLRNETSAAYWMRDG